MSNKPEKGFYYEALPEGTSGKSISSSDLELAQARPEHENALALLKHDLVIMDKRDRPNRFQIKKVLTYPTISKRFLKAFQREDFERQVDESYVLNMRGSVLLNVVVDAREGIVICLKELVPVKLQRGVPKKESPSANILKIRRLDSANEAVEELDGIDLLETDNPVHLVSRTLAKVNHCIYR